MSGGYGGYGGAGGGGLFADRADIPFISDPNLDGKQFKPGGFGNKLWSTRWYAWVVMSDLAANGDWLARLGGFDLLGTGPAPWSGALAADIDELRRMAVEERPDAMGEIISEADEFITKFLHLLSATPATHPATTRMLIVADALTAIIAMHYKFHFNRARPTQVLPGLLSPIQHTGHASYPSGHATQANAFAALLTAIIPASLGNADPTPTNPQNTTVGTALTVLAKRIARNREIAGLHYPSDTTAGEILSKAIVEKILLDPSYLPKFKGLVDAARAEWGP